MRAENNFNRKNTLIGNSGIVDRAIKQPNHMSADLVGCLVCRIKGDSDPKLQTLRRIVLCDAEQSCERLGVFLI